MKNVNVSTYIVNFYLEYNVFNKQPSQSLVLVVWLSDSLLISTFQAVEIESALNLGY